MLSVYAKNKIDAGILWDYDDRNAPYRLADFGGYDHETGRWADIKATGLVDGEVDDGQSFTLSWLNGTSWVPTLAQLKSAVDAGMDSFGFIVYHEGNWYPANTTCYYHIGPLEYLGSYYQYNTNTINTTDITVDQRWAIRPVLAYTNGAGVSGRLYSYNDALSRGFTFLMLESNAVEFAVISAAVRFFKNMQVVVNWEQGSISGSTKSFRGAVMLRNRNQTPVNVTTYIYNNDIDGYTDMYNTTVTVPASPDGTTWGWYEIMAGDMANTSWEVSTADDSAIFWIDLSINGRHITLTPTIGIGELPKRIVYELADYISL